MVTKLLGNFDGEVYNSGRVPNLPMRYGTMKYPRKSKADGGQIQFNTKDMTEGVCETNLKEDYRTRMDPNPNADISFLHGVTKMRIK